MAEAVGTSRQNIENLEAGDVRVPQYLVALADTMRCSTDELLGRHRAGLAVEEPTPFYRTASPEAALANLRALIAQMPEEARAALADALAGFVRSGGSEAYATMFLALGRANRSEH